jgi:hypothetical protein
MKYGFIVLSIAMAVALSMLPAALAAPSAPQQYVFFNKTTSNPLPQPGETFTFRLMFGLAQTATQSIDVRVIDRNPAPDYLKILTGTITGGAFYSSTIDGVVWEGRLAVGTLGYGFEFQAQVTGIPTTALADGYTVTNRAEMFNLTTPGSLPEATAQVQFRIMPRRIWLPVTLRG